ncbi:MAG: hypothetical protein HGA45_29450 [Chloroflexales bacterium]|nr:hypothetical protein [Chloroflexales bacterium]
MTSNKSRLGKMIGGGESPPPATPIQKGAPFQVSTAVAAIEPDLPAQIGELSAPLQEIARRYVGARRRSGEALLEAARWLTEARDAAGHGEWQVFLEATGTTDDTAERLLNIHRTAMQNPQFADAIARNWLGQSAAALLARPSTPPDVVTEMLGQEAAPSVTEVRGAIARSRGSRQAKGEGQNPQFADFAGPAERLQEPGSEGGIVVAHADGGVDMANLALEVLREATRAVESLHDLAPSLSSDEGRELIRRIRRAVQSLEERIP